MRELNGRRVYEANGRPYRWRIAKQLASWSGILAQDSKSSYLPELEAITRMSMILPSAWKVTLYTDSESAIKAIQNHNPDTPPHKRAQTAGWTLLEAFIATNNTRKNPINLVHISSHEQELNIKSVGNATADLFAKEARITQKPSGRLNTEAFAQHFNWQYKNQIIDNTEQLKTHIDNKHRKKRDKWDLHTSKQAKYLREGYKPHTILETLRKQLKRRHMGTLADVFTGAIFLKGWRAKEEERVICQYCLQARGKQEHLTKTHLTTCNLNKHAHKAVKLKVLQEAIEGWKVEWDTHTDKHDHITNTARTLINNTNATWTTKTVTIWNPNLRRQSIPVLQKTLEGISCHWCSRRRIINYQLDIVDATRVNISNTHHHTNNGNNMGQ